jgi:hypothetical protein
MTPEQFAKAIKSSLLDVVVRGLISQLEKPAGRSPDPLLLKRAAWFGSLDNEGKEMVIGLLTEAAHATGFSILCLLDGVATLDDIGRTGELKLYFEDDSDGRTLLNPSEGEMLHDIFNSA